MYGHGLYELSRMLIRKNVNNDFSKDSPIRWPIRVMHGISFLISRGFPISSYKARSRIIAARSRAIIRDLDL